MVVSVNEDSQIALHGELYTLLTKHVQEFAKRKAHDLCLASHMARAFRLSADRDCP